MLEYVAATAAAVVMVRLSRRAYRSYLRPKIKGHLGEFGIRRELGKLPSSETEVLHDLLLPIGRESTQIDHIVVSKYGVFPIETKNLSGLISGKEWDKEWLQYRKGRPHPIPNPVRQNYRHSVALKQLLKKHPNVRVNPIVVFSNASRLDVTSENTLVVNRRDLLSAIKSYCRKPVLTAEQVHQIAKELTDLNIKDRVERRQHREQAQMKKELFSSDELSKAYEEGKNSPVLHFTQHFTLEERILQEKIDHFRANGPVLTIRGHTDTIYGFLHQARRNKDNTVADDGKAFDHVTCPYTGAQFPPSELANLERGLWLSYFNKHPELAHHVSTKQGLTELFPSHAPGYGVVSAYAKKPMTFISQTKQSVWYQNLKSSFQKPAVEQQIDQAAQKKDCEEHTYRVSAPETIRE